MNKVPEEVLQWILRFFCCNDEEERTYGPIHLWRLCSIDRHWRLAAITHRPLWTTLPRIDFNDKKIDTCAGPSPVCNFTSAARAPFRYPSRSWRASARAPPSDGQSRRPILPGSSLSS